MTGCFDGIFGMELGSFWVWILFTGFCLRGSLLRFLEVLNEIELWISSGRMGGRFSCLFYCFILILLIHYSEALTVFDFHIRFSVLV